MKFELTEDLIKRMKLQIRKNTSPRHVPNKIIQVNDIPRTKSGKIVELAVKNIIEESKPDFAITHEPGCMFVTDLIN